MSKVTISVIITTLNSEKTIGACLQSVFSQTQIPKDCIVIDNFSTDHTLEIVKKYTKNVFKFGPERSAQRNKGAALAKGTHLLFLDSDMTLSPKVIEESLKQIQKNHALVGLYIPEEIIGDPFWSKIRTFERSFYNGTVIDASRVVNKTIFQKINGFDEALSAGEDWDLDRRLRELGKIEIVNSSLFHNESAINLRKYVTKKILYSSELDKYINKWGKNDKVIKKQLGFFYRYLGVFIENEKWRKVFLHPALFSSIILLKILIGVLYIMQKNNSK